MIRVVGANPAMDRVSTWPKLDLGGVNRSVAVSVVPGGKGLNVARAAVRLGSEATAYGFLGGHVGEALREMIVADGVVDRHTTIAAGTRVCFIVVEPEAERTSVLNEPGPAVSEAEVGRFLDGIRSDLAADDLLLVAGSLPDSVPPGVVREIIEIGYEAGARTVVDIHSEALRVAVACRPWLLKCNRAELLALLGAVDGAADGPPMPIPVLAAEMLRLRERGIEAVIVTLGPDGALLAGPDGVVHARAPQVDEVNATGSGDLVLAGFAVALERRLPTRAAIALGVACGSAGATHLPPELPPGFEPGAWLPRVGLEEVEAAR